MQKYPAVHSILERLAPTGNDGAGERIWRFSERMAAVYQEQMRCFDENAEARQWRQLYSAENMPPPSDTQNLANVAAMMAFYSPTNFCKFQKLVVQQLLEWESRQARLNPYPFAAPSITIIDIGAGVGIASLATIDVFATWADIVAELGYRQLGISVKVISVEPDINKQSPRRNMLNHLARLVDRHSINIESATDIIAPYPEPDCLRQILNAAVGGSLAICCMSNFVSSPNAGGNPTPELFSIQPGNKFGEVPVQEYEVVEWSKDAELEESAGQYAKATAQLLADIPVRSRLLLASELKQRGAAVRAFAGELYPGLEMLLHWNRVRFYSPSGSYWHALRSNQSSDPDWATGFWSLAHWGEESNTLATGTPDMLALGHI